jgi:RNA polymerase sigma-70 factor (ECF subfamily)
MNVQRMAKPIRQQLEEVYWEHRQGLFTLALSITRCHSRAEDAVHEAFTRLWKSHLSPMRGLVPYVFAAVRNAAIDQVRRTPAMQDVQQTAIYNGQMDDPLATAIDLERQELMRKAVEELPDDQRQAVVLHVYAELTFEQVADMLGEPLPTVASRYRRALERLKQTAQKLV